LWKATIRHVKKLIKKDYLYTPIRMALLDIVEISALLEIGVV
jgi:hypothetical protein